jgi:hypothetical protein
LPNKLRRLGCSSFKPKVLGEFLDRRFRLIEKARFGKGDSQISMRIGLIKSLGVF